MWTSPPGRTRERHVLGSIFILLGSIHLSSDRIFCSFWAPLPTLSPCGPAVSDPLQGWETTASPGPRDGHMTRARPIKGLQGLGWKYGQEVHSSEIGDAEALPVSQPPVLSLHPWRKPT